MTEEINNQNNTEQKEKEIEVEVLEFSLDEEEIDELIDKLKELKINKSKIHFSIDEENDLLIHHEEDEELNKI